MLLEQWAERRFGRLGDEMRRAARIDCSRADRSTVRRQESAKHVRQKRAKRLARPGHRWLVVCVAMLSLGALLAPGIAHATAGSYCGTKSNWFDGYANAKNDVWNWEGTLANITVRKGLVCDADSSSANSSSAWAMIAPTNTTGWAQSGYIRWWGSSIYQFAQHKRDSSSGYTTKLGSIPTTGSTYTYSEVSYWNSTAGQWQIKEMVNSTVLQHTNWNTFSYWTEPFEVAWDGETAYRESDVPGLSSSKAHFTNMQVQWFNDDKWYAASNSTLYGRTDSSRWSRSSFSTANQLFDIWTN